VTYAELSQFRGDEEGRPRIRLELDSRELALTYELVSGRQLDHGKVLVGALLLNSAPAYGILRRYAAVPLEAGRAGAGREVLAEPPHTAMLARGSTARRASSSATIVRSIGFRLLCARLYA
jgi:hypothetical protein